MMKKAVSLLFALVILTSFASGQHKETRDEKGFSKVSFGISGDLKIKIGPEFSVVLEGDKSDINEIITEVSGDKLLIKQENWHFNFNEKVNVYITMPELSGLGVSGSGKAEVVDEIKNADNLNLNVSGSGRLLTAGVETDNLDCSISGSGNITIGSSGNADRGSISISGSGNYRGESMDIDHLEVHVSGSGNCTCKAGDSLKAGISGSGNVNYYGDPKIDARVSGSGHVRSMK
ncbi:MAG TPA: head GIN domain-containing protein [Bacteroidales bacterium]|nr:head GIN domain-containing protein [Bacteroidales bacterium]